MKLDEQITKLKSILNAGGLPDKAELNQFIIDLESEIHRLKTKNDLLIQHNLELTQEMELVRDDFGGGR